MRGQIASGFFEADRQSEPLPPDRIALWQTLVIDEAAVLAGDLPRLHGTARQLWEEVERTLRQPRGKAALVLHLSRLAMPRPYHVRVARVLLQDSAQRHGGQVFTLADHDLVLLCQNSAAGAHAPADLPASLAKLFSADVADATRLTSFWDLEQDSAGLRAYLAGQAQHSSPATERAALRNQPVSLVALQEIIGRAPLDGLLTQQTGLCLSLRRGAALPGRLAPAFQQIGIGLEGLSLDPLVVHALGDAFLFRHFAAALDIRLVQLLRDDLSVRGRILRSVAAQGLPVLIELGLGAIASPDFAALVRRAASGGVRFWVAVSLLEAGSAPDLLEHAAAVLRLLGCRLVINRIDPQALALFSPAVLQPDFMVLTSSQLLRRLITIQKIGPFRASASPRLILAEVEDEEAMAWGQSHGIDLFQGPFLDQVQAATRMQACHSAVQCTLRQCCSRARSISTPGRAGCANPALLDAGFAASPARRGAA